MNDKHVPRVPKLKAGLMSCLNYPSKGYRRGLWNLAFDIFAEEKVGFIVLGGGLICRKTVNAEIKEVIKNAKKNKEDGEIEVSRYLEQIAKELAKKLPKIPNVKIHIVPSPEKDGPYGYEIALKLKALRSDIKVYQKTGGDRLPLRQVKLTLGVFTPVKSFFSSQYYDTPIHRVLYEQVKRSSHGAGDIAVAGGFGSSVFHPGDSTRIKMPYLSLPVLHKINVADTSENQVGVRVLSFYSDERQDISAATWSFKDLLSKEWKFVEAPKRASELQKQIVDAIRKDGPQSLGDLVDRLHKSRSDIEKEATLLVKKKQGPHWPSLELDDASNRYTFKVEWFQEKLRYSVPKGNTHDESFVSFGCLHAGCKHTHMEYFLEKLPEIILREKVRCLVGVGDFLEGFAHTLMHNNENYGSFVFPANNYDYQESLSGYLVGSVIVEVFNERMKPYLKGWKDSGVSPKRDEVLRAVKDALLIFLFIPGNHCEWTVRQGFSSLSVFTRFLESFVGSHIDAILAEANIPVAGVREEALIGRLVRLKEAEVYTLPSGLRITLWHPKMSRSLTTSIRLQEALFSAEGCHIVFEANFHVAEALEDWDLNLGQRLCVQLGTIKVDSEFERGKMKIVDFGVALTHVKSVDGRILRSETQFFAKKPKSNEIQKRNLELLQEFEAYLGKHELHVWSVYQPK